MDKNWIRNYQLIGKRLNKERMHDRFAVLEDRIQPISGQQLVE